jgi:hypothetical protein
MPPSLSKESWVSVLHLSQMWEMPSLREAAITQLGELVTDSTEKLRLADTYDVPAWSVPALLDLVNREASLTEADVHSIGLQRSLKVGTLRERRFREGGHQCDKCHTPSVLRFGCRCYGQVYLGATNSNERVPPDWRKTCPGLLEEDVKKEFGLVP